MGDCKEMVFWWVSSATFLSNGIFIHSIPTRFHILLLLAGNLTQEIADDPRVLVRFLLHLTLSNGVQRAEQPHFLQVADEGLKVFGGFDLFWDIAQPGVWENEDNVFNAKEAYHTCKIMDFVVEVFAKGCRIIRSKSENRGGTDQVCRLDLHLELRGGGCVTVCFVDL